MKTPISIVKATSFITRRRCFNHDSHEVLVGDPIRKVVDQSFSFREVVVYPTLQLPTKAVPTRGPTSSSPVALRRASPALRPRVAGAAAGPDALLPRSPSSSAAPPSAATVPQRRGRWCRCVHRHSSLLVAMASNLVARL